jgi:hypothetical protein
VPVVAGDEVLLEPGVGLFDVGDAVELELSDEAILKDAEDAFDPALGLGRGSIPSSLRTLPTWVGKRSPWISSSTLQWSSARLWMVWQS